MNENLEEFSLEDLGFIGRGKSKHRPRNDPSLYFGKYPFIQTGDVKNAEFYINNFSQTYNEKGLSQSKLWEKETLLITIAANIAETAILKFKACFPDSIVGFVPNKKICNIKYIKYYFDVFQKAFQQISQGSTQDNLSLEKLISLKIPLPNISIQNKIVNILSMYDDLISNNLKIIKLLNESMRITFDEYFLKFKVNNIKLPINSKKIPVGWQEVLLKKYIELEKGIEPGSDLYEYEKNNENISFLRVGDLNKRSSNLFIPKKVAGLKIVSKKDVLISLDGSPGAVRFGLNGSYSSGIRKAYAKNNNTELSNVFIYNLLNSQNIQKTINAYSSGTTIMHAGSSIKKMNFLLPEKSVLINYNKSEIKKYNLSILLMKVNEELFKSKEILLPRIILGKIKNF